MLEGTRWLPAAPGLVMQARAEMPQKNDLCGAFVTLVALRAKGIPIRDQDEAAVAAGVRLALSPSSPPGEKGRDDYRVPLPHATGPAEEGATPTGVAHAVETLSEGDVLAVPASGEWDIDKLSTLLSGLYGLNWVAPVANVDTGAFGAPDTPDRALLDYLDGGLPPFWTSRWRTGHFVLLGGMRTGPGGSVVSIVDTYPSLGDWGVHGQVIERLVPALRRETMPTSGGLLLVVEASERQAAEDLVTNAGLVPRLWA